MSPVPSRCWSRCGACLTKYRFAWCCRCSLRERSHRACHTPPSRLGRGLHCIPHARRAEPPEEHLRYSPCFLAGVVAYKLGTGSPRHWPASAWPVFLLAITTAFLLRPSVEAGWVCCLGVGIAVSRFHELSDGSLREACRLLARYSYGVYLSHAVLIWLAFDHLGAWPLTARWSLFVVTAVLVPVALYHGIEAPMIALGRLLVRRRAESSGRLSLAPLH